MMGSSIQKRVQIVHYDKTRFSETSRVRSQMAASDSYADSYLVLSAMKDEPWEPHWSSKVLVRHFLASQNTMGRFWQEFKIGFWLALEARKGRFDILHAHHNTALTVALVWIIVCGRPLVFDTHDLFSPRQNERRNLIRKFCLWFKWSVLQRPVLNRASVAVHVSPGIVNIYKKLYPRVRHVLLWNLPAFALDPGYSAQCLQKYEAAQKISADTGKLEILKPPGSGPPLKLVYFGLLSSSRITLDFIRMLASVPNIELSLYGRLYEEVDDFEEYSRGLSELVQAFPIRWPGAYKTSDLPAYLADSDMLVFPIAVETENNRHALPNKLFESCLNGVAVLCSNICVDIVDLAEEYGFGCGFDPLDQEAARISLEKLAGDRKLVESMKCGALRFACSPAWSPEAYKITLQKIYSPQPVQSDG